MIKELKADEIFRTMGFVFIRPLIQIAYAYSVGDNLPLPRVKESRSGCVLADGDGHKRVLSQLVLRDLAQVEVLDGFVSRECLDFASLRVANYPVMEKEGLLYTPYSEIPQEFAESFTQELINKGFHLYE